MAINLIIQLIDEQGKAKEIDMGEARKLRLQLRNTDSGNDALLYKGVVFPEKKFEKEK